MFLTARGREGMLLFVNGDVQAVRGLSAGDIHREFQREYGMQDMIGQHGKLKIRRRFERRSILDFIALLASVSLLAAGCASTGLDPYFAAVDSDANVYVSPGRSDIAKIAVLPFKGPTELIGASVSDLVVTEILRTRKYTLVERSQMAGVLSEAELAMAGLSESRAVEVAKMLGADGVVIGTVDEYATQAKSGKTYAVAGVALRLINCGTGQIIWSADLAEMASSADTPLSAHGRAVVHELMAGLYQTWARQRSFAPPRASASSADPVGGPRAASQAPVVSPAVPAGVAVSDLGLREATVKWQADNVVASRYRVERALAEAGPFAVVGEVKPSRGSFRDDQGLKDAAVYYYRVVAVGETGLASKPSPVVETMTAPPPDPPAAVKALAPSSRCVAVSWTPPRAEGVVKYRVERAEAGEAPKWALRSETDKTTFTDGGRAGCDVADSTKYLYRVTAVNRVGAVGEPSAGVEVETLPPPAVVADFFATPLQVRCVPLAWAANREPDVQGYEIERAEGEAGAFAKLERIRGRETTSHLDGRRDPGSLPDAQTYRYRIRAFNDVGALGEWTPPVEATTRPVPPPPPGHRRRRRLAARRRGRLDGLRGRQGRRLPRPAHRGRGRPVGGCRQDRRARVRAPARSRRRGRDRADGAAQGRHGIPLSRLRDQHGRRGVALVRGGDRRDEARARAARGTRHDAGRGGEGRARLGAESGVRHRGVCRGVARGGRVPLARCRPRRVVRRGGDGARRRRASRVSDQGRRRGHARERMVGRGRRRRAAAAREPPGAERGVDGRRGDADVAASAGRHVGVPALQEGAALLRAHRHEPGAPGDDRCGGRGQAHHGVRDGGGRSRAREPAFGSG